MLKIGILAKDPQKSGYVAKGKIKVHHSDGNLRGTHEMQRSPTFFGNNRFQIFQKS